VVLCLSGHDPSGGAGIQADIESLHAIGCHPCTVITALTVQDTRDVRRVLPQQAACLLEQAAAVVEDLPVAAVKIGLLGSAELASAVARLLASLAPVPVVLDPVLAAGGGGELASAELLERLRCELLPLATVLTPNAPEARRLAGLDGPLDRCAEVLLAAGCGHVLITGTHEAEGAEVVNRLYHRNGSRRWTWPRLPHSYHGSGCTLAAALAGFLALGHGVEAAAIEAQAYTWQALAAGRRLGRGQHLPARGWRPPGEAN
jgi:hydroxymethylpyrimidine/phosphomethylpyrimidine kinase